MTYISSQSLLSSVRQSVLQAQAGLAQAQSEVASGNQADLGVALGARTGLTVSLANEVDGLNGYAASNAVAATRLDATANTLATMVSTAQSMAAALVTAATTGGLTSGLQTSAKAGLQSLVAGLNTTVAGQHVFGGINSAVQPVADYFSAATSSAKAGVDAAFAKSFGFAQDSDGASSVGAAAMTSFLDGSFADLFSDANWSAGWSNASDTVISSRIAPGQTTATSVSANNTAFRQIAAAYTMLSEFTGSTMNADAKAAVVAKATSLVNSGLAALNSAQSGVGVSQAAIDSANTSASARATVLKSQVSDLESVDTFALSNRVTTLQTQLQASYELTSRLQSLSLVNYLNG